MPSTHVWSICVFGNVQYMIGARVLAHSIRKYGSKYDIMLIITEDIPCAVDPLFTHTVVVPYITAPQTPRLSLKQKQVYNKFVQNTTTKLNGIREAARLGYDKVIMLDADMLFASNCDNLFDLQAPAAPWGMFLASNARPDGSYPPITPYIDKMNLKTGDRIFGGEMMRQMQINRSFVCWGSIMLCEATLAAFDQIMSQLNIINYAECPSGPEEQLFAVYAAGGQSPLSTPGSPRSPSVSSPLVLSPLASPKIQNDDLQEDFKVVINKRNLHIRVTPVRPNFCTVIGHEYNFVPWKNYPNPLPPVPRIYHFHSSKPWAMPRDKWPDLKIWWSVADEIQSLGSGGCATLAT